MKVPGILSAILAAALVVFPASGQQMKTVDGVVINLGIINAIAAEHSDAQHGVHKGGHGSGMEHVLVSLAEQSGARIGDAEVIIEVINPKGGVQKKQAAAMITAGFPDYSEVFEFGWSGRYVITILIKRKGAARPVQARFTVNRVI